MPLPNFLIVGFPRCGTSFLLKTLPLHSFYAHRVREFKLGHPSGFDPEKYSFSDIVLRDLNINQVNISNYDFMFFIRENVLPLFNRNQIKIIVNEEIHQDTKTVLQGIFKLLQLKEEDLEIRPKKNYDEQSKYECIDYNTVEYKQALQKLIDYYQPSVKELYDYLGREIASWKTFDKVYAQILG